MLSKASWNAIVDDGFDEPRPALLSARNFSDPNTIQWYICNDTKQHKTRPTNTSIGRLHTHTLSLSRICNTKAAKAQSRWSFYQCISGFVGGWKDADVDDDDYEMTTWTLYTRLDGTEKQMHITASLFYYCTNTWMKTHWCRSESISNVGPNDDGDIPFRNWSLALLTLGWCVIRRVRDCIKSGLASQRKWIVRVNHDNWFCQTAT